MKLTSYLLFAPLILMIVGCKSIQDYEYNLGQKELNYFNYSLGIDYFLKSWESYPVPKTARALAQSYLKIRNFEQAEAWYARLEREGALTEADYIGYADALISNSNYEKASKILNQQTVTTLDTAQAIRYNLLKSGAEQAKSLINTPTKSEVSALDKLNTEYSDFGGFFVSDTIMMFVNDELLTKETTKESQRAEENEKYGWTGNGYLKVFQTDWDATQGKAVGEKKLFELLTADLHVGPIHISDYFTFFTVTKNERYKPEKIQLQKSDNTIHPEIMYLINSDSAKFENAKSLPFNSTFDYVVSDPFYDQSLNRLYFSSTMPGGFGGADLYYTFYFDQGKWTTPINLGSQINSAGDERSPFVAKDGTLYFSSNGLGGIGGLDVFQALKEGTRFVNPKNLGNPINSNRDDFSFYMHPSQELTAIFASDRSGGKGSDDLYKVELAFDTNFVIKGRVIDQTSKKPISDAVIRLLSEAQATERRFISLKDGSFSFEVSANQAVTLISKSFGYFEQAIDKIQLGDILLSKDSVIYQDILMERIEVGGVYKLENIYYEYAQWQLSSEAKNELKKLAVLMKRNPTLKVDLYSHTDSRGDSNYNLALSEKRASAAVKYILSEGISPTRIKGKGMGESQLMNQCADGVDCFEPEHEENRRTEFKIIDF